MLRALKMLDAERLHRLIVGEIEEAESLEELRAGVGIVLRELVEFSVSHQHAYNRTPGYGGTGRTTTAVKDGG